MTIDELGAFLQANSTVLKSARKEMKRKQNEMEDRIDAITSGMSDEDVSVLEEDDLDNEYKMLSDLAGEYQRAYLLLGDILANMSIISGRCFSAIFNTEKALGLR